MTMNEALKRLEHCQFDPHFQEFYNWSLSQEIPLVILSSGLKPIINHFLTKHLTDGLHHSTKVIANDLQIHPTYWEILYLDDSSFGHDKGTALRQAKASIDLMALQDRPLIIFIGDGVSDLSAALEADLVFAKIGKDLETWCIRKSIDYIPWNDWSDILNHLRTLH